MKNLFQASQAQDLIEALEISVEAVVPGVCGESASQMQQNVTGVVAEQAANGIQVLRRFQTRFPGGIDDD